MANNNSLGIRGEQVAAQYLLRKGYVILERNWRYKKKEIDLIARHNEILVFIEVKTRSGIYFGEPASHVSKLQMNRIAQLATVYMHEIGYDWEIRFDIIGLLFHSPQRVEIKHYEDVWFNE